MAAGVTKRLWEIGGIVDMLTKKTCGQKISAAVKFKLGPSVPTTALP